MNLKSLFKIGFLGVGNAFNSALGFAFLAMLARTMSISDLGRYALLASLLLTLGKLTDLGINSMYVSKTQSDQTIVNNFFSAKILLLLVTLPVSIILLYIIGFTLPVVYLTFLLGLVAYAGNFTFFGLFQKREEYFHLVMLNSMPAFIKGGFAISIFLNKFTPTLETAFIIFSLAIYASWPISLLLPSSVKPNKFSKKGAFSLILEAYKAGVSQLITEGWSAINNLVAKMFKNFTDVGILSVADKLARVFSIISVSIFTVLLPKNARRKEHHLAYDLTESSLLSVGIILFAILIVFISKPLVLWVFGERYIEAIGILNVLIFASAFTAIHSFFESYFFVQKRVPFILKLALIKLVLFLGLSTFLISKYSIMGIAISQLIASSVILVLSWGTAIRIEGDNNSSA